MADAQATFTELRSLLARLPGTHVEATDIMSTGFFMTLSITEPDSVGPIVYCAGGANIPVDLWSTAPQGQVAERRNPKHLRYHLRSRISDEVPQAKALDRFAMFGNFLVWHLHADGSIPTSEANRLLTMWNGRHVAA